MGVRLLSDWDGGTLRRYTEDSVLEICLRLKGGDPADKTPLNLDDELCSCMAAIQLIRKWAQDNTED
eukprot:501883-Prorocentrum_lima.AAC.1